MFHGKQRGNRKMKAEILTMNKINYIEKWKDSDFQEQRTPNTIYYLTCMYENGSYFKIKLWQTNGSCGSGYCNATWGNFEYSTDTTNFAYTHTPKAKMNFDANFYNNPEEVYKCEWFSFDYDGGDGYYPNGSIWVNEEMFIQTDRYIDKPTTRIFIGDSVTGKSYIAHKIDECVYETDSCSSLPDNLDYDIIVVGNKYKYTLEEIKQRISKELRIVLVDFKADDKETTDNALIEKKDRHENNIDEIKKWVLDNFEELKEVFKWVTKKIDNEYYYSE